MIHRYDYGTPIPTHAVVKDIPVEQGNLPFFAVAHEGESVTFTHQMHRNDIVFGLGETVRGINKRGHLYKSWNMDDMMHLETKGGLYASHNFLIFYGEGKCFGVFFDDPGLVEFDLGYTQIDTAKITSANGGVSVYLIEEDSLIAVCRAFRELTGRSYIPPKWAFGYMQSRWGYATDKDVEFIAEEHRKRHIPLDSVCMDIDYMEDFKDFTWDASHFPDLPGFAARMKADHIRLVPIIDAGVKQVEGYDVCEEGLEKGYFCKKADGSEFIGAVWPGRSYFPDFMRDDVRQWFGDKYHRLLDAGVEGFWNDMKEPALFYTPETLEKAFADVDALKGVNVGIYEYFDMKDIFANVGNNPEDYRRFYHDVNGQLIRHDKLHNLYGAMMTRAAAQGFKSYDPDKRVLMFSRSSYIGAHRDAGVWQGDNSAWWGHLQMCLKMLPNLNMTGFLYNGADLGGFGSNTTEDLVLRFLELGVFTPLMRNHAAQGTRDQEIFRFSTWEDMKNVVTVRYALIPYLYSEFVKAAMTDGMYFRPLAFDYPQDKTALRIEDQVMLGNDCMIAPVIEQNARGRHVYLPEDMLMVRFRSADDYDQVKLEKGHHWIEIDLHELPLFIKRGHAIPMAKAAEYVEGIDTSDLTMLGWLDEDIDVTLYDDDGYTTHIDRAKGLRTLRVKA